MNEYKKLTPEQRLKLDLKLRSQYEIKYKENSEHLDIDLYFKEDSRLRDTYNLKIKIVQTLIKIYKKYPTLDNITFYYTKNVSISSRSKQGWSANVSQLRWVNGSS